MAASSVKPLRGLYLIADFRADVAENEWLARVALALRGGATVLQYRDKHAAPIIRTARAQALRSLATAAQVPFIINDDVALAADLDADGVHIGRDDAALARARVVLGPDKIIGVSCYNELTRAQQAQTAGADYVAFGSFFASRTKPLAVRADIELLRAARAQLHVPIVAIGGITPENGEPLVAAGADALAVIDGVLAAEDPLVAAQRYVRLFD